MDTSLSERYRARQQRLMAQMGEGIALLQAGGVTQDPLLYDKNVEYLTGITGHEAVLLLAPKGVRVDYFETLQGPELGRGRVVNSILFVNERTQAQTFIDGPGAGMENVKAAAGVDRVLSRNKLNETLNRNLMRESVLWLNTPGAPQLGKPLSEQHLFINELRERFYWLEYRNIAKCIHQMRFVKDEYEIECLRQAFAIHAEIFTKIMGALKPGTNEALGQAIFDYEVTTRPREVTAGLEKYDNAIIVAAGKNAMIGHYMANNQEIHDGDLVLIDAGVSYKGYYSDITSTFPANGTFTPRQREVYAIVLEAQKQAIAAMRPGVTEFEVHQAVYNVFKAHGLEQYGYGRCGHSVGLSIHDVYPMPDAPLEPGCVIVIEPFIMLPDEGIGIRLEVGVLITENGAELLPHPTQEIDEVEAACRRD